MTFLILEIFGLLIVCGIFVETARRRGGKGWPFVVMGLLGYFALGWFTLLLVGSGPDLIVSIAWLAIVYAGIFLLIGGGRRAAEPWQCPECRLYNDRTTLVCGCGQSAPETP